MGRYVGGEVCGWGDMCGGKVCGGQMGPRIVGNSDDER